jgi:hypothetical protein
MRSLARMVALAACVLLPFGARGTEEESPGTTPPNLVKAANAPLSDVLQLRVQDTYIPEFHRVDGDANTLSLAITMPLPKYRLIPFPQLSLLTIPASVTSPGSHTGFGDLHFVDVAILDPGHKILFGIGPTFVFPSADDPSSGQGKWQIGPAAAFAFSPGPWLLGVLAQNPISFAGDRRRADTNALFLQPFATYQLGAGWFLRSQPQIAVDWKSGGHVVPLDLGAGRVFDIGSQHVNLFVEPFWTLSHDGPAPVWGLTVGVGLLYPNFWRRDQ